MKVAQELVIKVYEPLFILSLRSPDLTPCDYFLWGYLINKAYATPPINVYDLRIRITAEVNILKENPELMKKVIRSMKKSTGLRK